MNFWNLYRSSVIFWYISRARIDTWGRKTYNIKGHCTANNNAFQHNRLCSWGKINRNFRKVVPKSMLRVQSSSKNFNPKSLVSSFLRIVDNFFLKFFWYFELLHLNYLTDVFKGFFISSSITFNFVASKSRYVNVTRKRKHTTLDTALLYFFLDSL